MRLIDRMLPLDEWQPDDRAEWKRCWKKQQGLVNPGWRLDQDAVDDLQLAA
jgi:hypothetical protein